MTVENVVPWSFTIEFDAEKAARNGYDVETLYEYVDKNVQRFGLTRLAHGTWKANEEDRVGSQCLTMSLLSEEKWVMQNICSFTAYEVNTAPIDFIAILRKRCPELLYA